MLSQCWEVSNFPGYELARPFFFWEVIELREQRCISQKESEGRLDLPFHRTSLPPLPLISRASLIFMSLIILAVPFTYLALGPHTVRCPFMCLS